MLNSQVWLSGYHRDSTDLVQREVSKHSGHRPMFQALSGCRDMKVTEAQQRIDGQPWKTETVTQSWESLPSRLLDYAFVRLI